MAPPGQPIAPVTRADPRDCRGRLVRFSRAGHPGRRRGTPLVRWWAGRAAGAPARDRRAERLSGARRRHRHQPGAHPRLGPARRWTRRLAGGSRPRATTAPPPLGRAMRRMARGALLGARGNSGVIVSQILRGMADTFATAVAVRGGELARALRTATEAAYAAVARPVEGTVLSVVAAAAEGAGRIKSDDLLAVARAAARVGGRGAGPHPAAAAGAGPRRRGRRRRPRPGPAAGRPGRGAGRRPPRPTNVPPPSAHPEVTGRLERPAGPDGRPAAARDPAVDRSRTGWGRLRLRGAIPARRRAPTRSSGCAATLDGLGDSLVVVGTGEGEPPTWNVHVHVPTTSGPAIEAGRRRGPAAPDHGDPAGGPQPRPRTAGPARGRRTGPPSPARRETGAAAPSSWPPATGSPRSSRPRAPPWSAATRRSPRCSPRSPRTGAAPGRAAAQRRQHPRGGHLRRPGGRGRRRAGQRGAHPLAGAGAGRAGRARPAAAVRRRRHRHGRGRRRLPLRRGLHRAAGGAHRGRAAAGPATCSAWSTARCT